MENPMNAISRVIRENDGFLVASHYNPDGDAIGSLCAMGHILAALGKEFILYNPSGLPERFGYVPHPSPITTELPEVLPPHAIVLDCGSAERMGDALRQRTGETSVLNIDHHLGNENFGAENWVDSKMPAVGNMVGLLADDLSVPLTGPLAECVYLAMATDTGFFAYGSTTPECLELTARMLRDGLNIERMNMLITKQWSEKRMHLWAEAMSGVKLYRDGLVALTVITKEMFDRTGTTNEDTESIINFLRKLKPVRVAAILREEGDDLYKLSLRSYGEDNVQRIAARFGGGGHKNAAGGTIAAPLDQARDLLISTIVEGLGED